MNVFFPPSWEASQCGAKELSEFSWGCWWLPHWRKSFFIGLACLLLFVDFNDLFSLQHRRRELIDRSITSWAKSIINHRKQYIVRELNAAEVIAVLFLLRANIFLCNKIKSFSVFSPLLFRDLKRFQVFPLTKTSSALLSRKRSSWSHRWLTFDVDRSLCQSKRASAAPHVIKNHKLHNFFAISFLPQKYC